MSHIHIIDGGTTFGHSQGELNHTLANTAQETLKALGHKVTKVCVTDDYDIEQEIEQFVAADSLILQMPGWWMGEPWTNISTKFLPSDMAVFMPMMGAAAPIAKNIMVLVVCCRVRNTCFH